jgi:hypothetical protein
MFRDIFTRSATNLRTTKIRNLIKTLTNTALAQTRAA